LQVAVSIEYTCQVSCRRLRAAEAGMVPVRGSMRKSSPNGSSAAAVSQGCEASLAHGLRARAVACHMVSKVVVPCNASTLTRRAALRYVDAGPPSPPHPYPDHNPNPNPNPFPGPPSLPHSNPNPTPSLTLTLSQDPQAFLIDLRDMFDRLDPDYILYHTSKVIESIIDTLRQHQVLPEGQGLLVRSGRGQTAHSIHTHSNVHDARAHTSTKARTDAYIHTLTHIHTHARTHARMHARTHTRMHVRARTQVTLRSTVSTVVVTTLVLEGWSSKLNPELRILDYVRDMLVVCGAAWPACCPSTAPELSHSPPHADSALAPFSMIPPLVVSCDKG